MTDEYRLRLEALRGYIDRIGAHWRTKYSNAGAHYERVANRLHDLFGDEVLAQAGYFHGLPAQLLQSMEPGPLRGVPEVVNNWWHLRDNSRASLGSSGPAQQLTGELHSLREPQAAPLLVIERLDRWDPEGEMLRWTRDFSQSPRLPPDRQTAPQPYPPSVATEHLQSGRLWREEQERRFLRLVVSPAAEFCGLWGERNTAENIAFRDEKPDTFNEIVRWCMAMTRDCQEVANTIENILLTGKRERCVWEWRHVASIGGKLEIDRPESHWSKDLWQCWYVTVVCDDWLTCYQMLGSLHCAGGVKYDTNQFRDTLGKPTTSGYQALHSVVAVGDILKVKVRFVLRESRAGQGRWRDLLKNRLDDKQRQEQAPSPDRIRVYTPMGACRPLPHGATVLDFAADLHRRFVGRVEYAILNGTQKVDLLHRLDEGDSINLVPRQELRMPPPGWEQQVSMATKIRDMLIHNFRPQLREAGRARLLETLRTRGFKQLEDELFNSLLSMATEEVTARIFTRSSRRNEHRNVGWWDMHLGLLDLHEKGGQLPCKLQLDRKRERDLIETIESLRERLITLHEKDLDPALLRGSLRLMTCTTCTPELEGDVVATLEKRNIVLHKPQAPCAQGGKAVPRIRRHSMDLFFVIETDDRDGVVVDLLSVFHRANVPVVEVAARRVGLTWAVIRIEADAMVRPSVQRQLREEIARTAGVRRVIGPGEPTVQVLEDALPPRRTQREHVIAPTPYTFGDVVRDNNRFYGRASELGTLKEHFEFQRNGAQTGVTAFVNGPLKTGKTSLVLRFLRDVERSGDTVVIALHTAETGEPWDQVEAALTRTLSASVGRLNHSLELRGQPKIAIEGSSLRDVLSSIRRGPHPPVIIMVVDEVMRPFRHAHFRALAHPATREEVVAIQRTEDLIRNTPGTMMIWVGPSAPMGYLCLPLQQVLRSTALLPVAPLGWSDAADLLGARWLYYRYRITVPKKVAQTAWEETGGNPFWLNVLGHKMWAQASASPPSEGLKYDQPLLSAAIKEMLGDKEFFQDRFLAEESDTPPWLPELLRRLSMESETRNAGLTLPELLSQLAGARFCDPQALQESLAGLEAMGGLCKKGDQYKIAAPLLARWVLQNYTLLENQITRPR